MRHHATVPAALLAAFTVLTAFASTGTTRDARPPIVVGLPIVTSGSFASASVDARAGAAAALARVQRAGGIDGRSLELRTRDASLDAEGGAGAVRALVESDGALVVLGSAATAPAKTIAACASANVALVGVANGASGLRGPAQRNVFHVRASLVAETERLVQWLVDERQLERIACVHSDDALGRDGHDALATALDRRGRTILVTARFPSESILIGPALMKIAETPPEAIVMFADTRSATAFTKAARFNEDTLEAQLCTTSDVDLLEIARALGEDAEGVAASRVVPFPFDVEVPLVREFQDDMRALGEEARIGFASLESYVAARFAARVLGSLGAAPTRESFAAQAARCTELDLGGFTLAFGADDREGSDATWLVKLDDGRLVQVR